MITIELESRRQLIIEAIAELDSTEALAKVQKYIKNLQKKKRGAKTSLPIYRRRTLRTSDTCGE